jgi:hypothetical protein
VVPIERIERLKRFSLFSLNREYNGEGSGLGLNLSVSESMQWHDVGFQPRQRASQDRRKFDLLMDDFIERPCQALDIDPARVWRYALAQGKNFFRDTKYREYVRESSQTNPEGWAKKLCEDRKLVGKITRDPKIKDMLVKAIEKEINSWYVKLESETEWELTSTGEAHWSWKRSWM